MGPKDAPPFDDGDNDMEMGPQSYASPSEPGPLPEMSSEDGLPDFDATNTTEDMSEMAKKKAAKKSTPKTKKPAGKVSKVSAKKASTKPAKAAQVKPVPKKPAKPGQGHTRFIGILLHLSKETLTAIDKKVEEARKKHPNERHSRSSWGRALIMQALK